MLGFQKQLLLHREQQVERKGLLLHFHWPLGHPLPGVEGGWGWWLGVGKESRCGAWVLTYL